MFYKKREGMNFLWFLKSTRIPLPERVLVIHPFGIGDAIFVTPLLRALKESGVKRIDLLLGSRTREIFEHNPHINQIFEWDKSPVKDFDEQKEKWRKLADLFRAIWSTRYQVVFDFSPTAQYAFISLLFFWIPVRIGFNFKRRGFFLTHKQELPKGYANKPVMEYYCSLLQFLGIEPVSKKTELFLNEQDRTKAGEILRDCDISDSTLYLVVAPGGGESWGKDARLKRWPVEYFGKLIQALHQNYPHAFDKVLILGGQNEYFLGTQLVQRSNDIQIHNLCGASSIRIAAALIERASLFIGNDGGLVHVAHAVGTPVVAIYGPVDPVVYGPYPGHSRAITVTNEGPACRPCYQKFRYQATCQGIECLNELLPERVFEEIRSRNLFHEASSIGKE
ncbi:MAG: glycosyltransferase family 9 protein [Candidatus Omnitrophica bacterium]|nr:glycosyltransferase family 9 protein [Candidatus Omnitrophota bacterium]